MDGLVLRNATLVTGQRIDLVVDRHGKVHAITCAGQSDAAQIIDCSGWYLSSGWIDYHVHAYSKWDPYGDDLDEIGVKQGVTTVVDAGSCGADQIADLLRRSNGAKTRLYAYLNVSRIGLSRSDELSNLAWLREEAIAEALKQHRAAIIGLKARVSASVVGELGIRPLQIAREIADRCTLPLMVHIGSAPPPIEEVLDYLQQGDVLTHYLHAKPNNGVFDEDERPRPAFLAGLKRGMELDVGHGTASFSFRMAELARRNGIPLGTISTDIYRANRLNGPVFSLAHVMTKFLHIGYSLEEVIQAVTARAAVRLNKPEWGRIRAGEKAQLTLFSLVQKPMVLTDATGDERIAEMYLKPEGVVVDGAFIPCSAWTEEGH